MNSTGIVFILIISFIFLSIITYFGTNVFNKLRAQNVNLIESIFLSFIYLISYLFSKYVPPEDLEISREKIRKLAIPHLILIFGIFFIICIVIYFVSKQVEVFT